MRIIRIPAMLLIAAFLLAATVSLATQPASAESEAAGYAPSAAPQPLGLAQEDPYQVHELSSLTMLRDQFNHDYGRPRLILFLSPT